MSTSNDDGLPITAEQIRAIAAEVGRVFVEEHVERLWETAPVLLGVAPPPIAPEIRRIGSRGGKSLADAVAFEDSHAVAYDVRTRSLGFTTGSGSDWIPAAVAPGPLSPPLPRPDRRDAAAAKAARKAARNARLVASGGFR